MQPASYYVVGHLWFSFCHRSPCFEIGRRLAAARAGFRHEIPSGLFFFVQEESRCKQDQLQDSAQMVPRQIKYMLWNSTFVDSYLLLLIFPSKRLGWSSIYGLQLAPQENRDFIFNLQLDWGIRIATWFTTCNIRTKIAEIIRLCLKKTCWDIWQSWHLLPRGNSGQEVFPTIWFVPIFALGQHNPTCRQLIWIWASWLARSQNWSCCDRMCPKWQRSDLKDSVDVHPK